MKIPPNLTVRDGFHFGIGLCMAEGIFALLALAILIWLQHFGIIKFFAA